VVQAVPKVFPLPVLVPVVYPLGIPEVAHLACPYPQL
jgi:hypothetical protein